MLVVVGVCSTVFFLARVGFIWTQDLEVLKTSQSQKKSSTRDAEEIIVAPAQE